MDTKKTRSAPKPKPSAKPTASSSTNAGSPQAAGSGHVVSTPQSVADQMIQQDRENDERINFENVMRAKNAEFAQVRAEVKQEKARLKKLDDELAKWTGIGLQAEANITNIEQDVVDKMSRLNTYLAEDEARDEERFEGQRRIDEKAVELAEKRVKTEDLEEDNKLLDGKIQTLRADVSCSKEMRRTADDAYYEAKTQLDTAREILESKQRTNTQLNQEISKADQFLQDLIDAKKANTGKKVSHQEYMDALQRQLLEIQRKCDSQERQIASTKRQSDDMVRYVDTAYAKKFEVTTSYEAMLGSLAAELDAVKRHRLPDECVAGLELALSSLDSYEHCDTTQSDSTTTSSWNETIPETE